MSTQITTTTYVCDWTDEHGDVCGESRAVSNTETGSAWNIVREEGWSAYTNAYVRRDRWTTGAELIFCPIHSTVFRNNHGWGGLEDYKPPTHPWRNFFRKARDD